MIHSPPGPNLYESWQALADGLQVQRLLLHVPQLREQLLDPASSVALFAQAPPSVLTARPAPLAEPAAQVVIDQAALRHWLRMPAEYGTADAGTNPLEASADRVADTLLGDVADPVVRAAVATVCRASAWWTGAFAVIRHLGVHHTTLRPADPAITLETLRSATSMVALGTTHRLAENLGCANLRATAAKTAIATLIRDAGDPDVDDRGRALRTELDTAGLTSTVPTLEIALAFHQAVLNDQEALAATIGRLREQVRSGGYAYCVDIAHFLGGLPLPEDHVRPHWLDGETVTRSRWRNLVTARRELRRAP